MGSAGLPPPPLATVHLLRVGQALHSCPNLASLRHSALLTLLIPTRARLVNDYAEGSVSGTHSSEQNTLLGRLPAPAGLDLAFPDLLVLGPIDLLLWLPICNIS